MFFHLCYKTVSLKQAALNDYKYSFPYRAGINSVNDFAPYPIGSV